MPGVNFTDYNIEQQAAIVQDYWLKMIGKPTIYNKENSDLEAYGPYINEIRNSGPPSEHPILSHLSPFIN